jgi:hypothetical protein
MSTCNDCYSTNTAQPCASVGCLSTNYAKCITYSGSNLFCQSGAIATFTFSGVAVAPTVNTTVVASATGGSGTGATFTVIRTAGQQTYQVTVNNQGSGYQVSNTLTIPGTSLGGASPLNDITINVTTLAAVIANGQDLDSIITNINNRLCLIASTSPSGLDYTGFNYQCLRVGGNLESVGTVITSAEQFVEATAAALCSIHTRVKALETPIFTVSPCHSGTLTSGVSTLSQVLTLFSANLCTLNTNTELSSVNGNPCPAYTFSTRPANNVVLSDYINWITSNMCGMYNAQSSLISAQTTKVNNLYTYITGSTSGTVPASIDTSCLTGGSTTSSLKDAMTLVVSELCSTISTIGGLPSSNYTVDWSCFDGTYPSNSIFNVVSPAIGTFTNTASLQTHLNQIVKVLSALNIQFGSGLTIADSSGECGTVLNLTGGSTFTCSSLSTCSIANLADVDFGGLGSLTHSVLTGTGSSLLQPKLIRNGVYRRVAGSTQQTQWSSAHQYNPSTGYLEGAVQLPIYQDSTLNPITAGTFPSGGAYSVDLGRNCTIYPMVKHYETSGLATFRGGSAGFKITNAAGTSQAIPNLTGIDCFQASSVGLSVSADTECLLPVQHFSSGGTLQGLYMMTLRIKTSSSSPFLSLFNYTGSSIGLNTGDYLMITLGGITWAVE